MAFNSRKRAARHCGKIKAFPTDDPIESSPFDRLLRPPGWHTELIDTKLSIFRTSVQFSLIKIYVRSDDAGSEE